MIKRLIVPIILMFPLLQFAQDYSADWKGYFSYYNIGDVVKTENKIYAAGENSIFTYDLVTREYGEITTVNGLSGESISTIFYSEEYQLLLIGYEKGLIEVVFNNNDKVLSVVDIIGKSGISEENKRINAFNAFENLVYISTNYGISIFDLERLEFGDTFFIGDFGSQIPVKQTAILDGSIYAACSDGAGVRKAQLSNPNLIDYQNWEMLFLGNFVGIQSTGNEAYVISTNRRIYIVDNNSLNELFIYDSPPVDLKFSGNKLVVTLPDEIFVYSDTFQFENQIIVNSEFSTSFNSSVILSNDIYIGTTDFGVLKTSLLNSTSFEEFHPSCPLFNSAFSITAHVNGLWVTYGRHDLFLNPYEPFGAPDSFGISHLNNEEWVNIPYQNIFDAKSLKNIDVNPFNNNQVFIGSYFSGLLEINDEVPTLLHNHTNSGLESLVSPTNPNYIDIRVSSSLFDDNGVLWTTTNFTDRPLKSYNPSNDQWRSYDLKEIIPSPGDNNGFNDLEIGGDQTKWLATYSKGVIGFNENGGNKLIKNIFSEEQNMPSELITTLELDKRNQLWIGTNKGLRVLFNTSGFFEGENVTVDEIIIEEDGITKELLFQQSITDILVDGSNNKWISTSTSGLFYFSSDGQKTIFHFTTDNSPLPSDDVVDLSLDSSTGILYVATERGLVSFKAGGSNTLEDLESAYAYPNPVRPSFNMVDEKIKIKGISENVNIKITDIEGNLVAEAQSKTNQRYRGYNLEIDGGTAFWNGKNLANNIVASGVYLVMLSDLDTFETRVLKLMVVR